MPLRSVRHLALAALLAVAAAACGRTIVDDWGPMGTLVVSVVDGGGARMAGATVVVGQTSGPAMHTVTTAAGYDYRDACFAGGWTVRVTPPAGYALAPGQASSVDAQVAENQTTRVSVTLAPTAP